MPTRIGRTTSGQRTHQKEDPYYKGTGDLRQRVTKNAFGAPDGKQGGQGGTGRMLAPLGFQGRKRRN